MPTAIGSWRLSSAMPAAIRSRHEDEKMEEEEKEDKEEEQPLIKSNNPHLAGKEITVVNMWLVLGKRLGYTPWTNYTIYRLYGHFHEDKHDKTAQFCISRH